MAPVSLFLSVIPDSDRGSRSFCSRLGRTNGEAEEKTPGFPIKNVGNDREGKTGMTAGEAKEGNGKGHPLPAGEGRVRGKMTISVFHER